MNRPWLILAFLATAAHAGEPQPPCIDAASQQKVVQLLQTALGGYWNRADPTNNTESSSSNNFAKLESSFREASALMPGRVDLRFGLASALVVQAIQTNGLELDLKMNQALRVYQQIQALDTNDFEAGILYAAYTRAMGETNASFSTVEELMAVHPQPTHDYLERFQRTDWLLGTRVNEKPRKTMPKDEHHAIVVFGAMLETNGTTKPKLAARLQQGLKLARIYPRAPLILSGGNQKNGVTEAYVMSCWFKRKGISGKRIYLEDQAKDTVGNAIFSSAILKKLGITHVTLVTSVNHMRRALADLQEACLQRGLQLQYDNLASTGEPDFDQKQEQVAIYRDVMRTSGIWAFPGIQR